MDIDIKCTKEKLINGLSIALKAVPTRTTLPILECILITAENNFIKLLANNLEMAIETSSIEAKVNTEGCIAVDAKMFFEIIKKLPDADIFIKSENNLVKIKAGRSEFKIPCQSSDEFPKFKDIDNIENINQSDMLEVLAEDFRDMVKQTIFAVSQDESKPVLMGELLEIKDKKINMVALDGFRIAFRSLALSVDKNDMSVVIPAKSLTDIVKILYSSGNSDNNNQEKICIYFTEKHALFELKSCRIVTRLIDGKFLKYENIFTDNSKTSITINRKDFLDSIERASLISTENKKNPVKFSIDNSKIIVTSNTDLQGSYEELDTVTDGEPLDIAFNPKYFLDVLKALDCKYINIKFMESVNPCVIRPVSDIDAKYLILPLRLKE